MYTRSRPSADENKEPTLRSALLEINPWSLWNSTGSLKHSKGFGIRSPQYYLEIQDLFHSTYTNDFGCQCRLDAGRDEDVTNLHFNSTCVSRAGQCEKQMRIDVTPDF